MYRVEFYEDVDRKQICFWYSWNIEEAKKYAEIQRKRRKTAIELRKLNINGVWVSL